MQTSLLNISGQELKKLDLNDAIFGQKPSKEFLHEFVTVYLANQRQSTAHTKTRAEVSGSGKKPWKQKHTGRARAGSFRSPLWRHGGITFGPRQGRVRLEMPRRKSRAALAQALAARYGEGGIIFIESLSMEQPKTRAVAEVLKNLKCRGRTIFVVEQAQAKLSVASRNIPDVEIRPVGDLNAYEVLRCKTLVMTQAALEKLCFRWN